MKKRTPLAIGITLVLSTATALAAQGGIDRTVTRDPIQNQQQPLERGQRFVVKTKTSAVPRAVLSDALASSVRRAGLVGTTAPGARPAGVPAAQAQVLRSMAVPGWYVVQASRKLTDAESASFMRELAADSSVETVEVDRLYRRADTGRVMGPTFVPNDPNSQRLQWNFYNPTGGVRAEKGWDISTGKGVVVAVVDTGIVENNPELQTNVLPGYDMITDRRVSRRDSDGRAPGGWDVGDWVEANYCDALGWDGNPPEGSSWHGSHVAGTIAQQTNNNIGVAGLAFDAKVLPVRVLGSCGGFGSDIADGILWAAGAPVAGLPTNPNPAEVINMSLGSGGPQTCPTLYQDAIDKVTQMGTIVVVAAGNSNADAGTYTMGSCSNVIVVGATRVTGGKASYSSWGQRVDLSAPGGGGGIDGDPDGYIFQVVNEGTTRPTANWILGGFTGTSMASPHVAAAVAMVQSVAPTPLKWDQMRELLRKTTRPFPVSVPTATPMGSGILNLDALLRNATEAPCTSNCAPPTMLLDNKLELRGLASSGDDAVFSFRSEAGKTLSFMTFGGTGNVSMYAAFERVPSATDSDARSVRSNSNTETVRFTAPKAGTYYIKLTGTYADLTIVARQ
ncbi:serine protease [Xanthomonas campestris]|uniref:S8 family peptidase n=1 Tax=Xanthomonas sp. CFBP 8151 TaxID=3035310 RepID=UPI00141A8697|nr:S8 family peptidase [Xanthomonas sp. CFBP 8151]MEB1610517.1 S8 family peptidase [Xanthomonas campestris pv. campestris]NIJ78455.1 serine protease [Xanthomonas sp. CFBP 8151]